MTQTTLSLSSAQVSFGQEDSEVLTSFVLSTGQGGGSPTGTVTILEGSAEVCHFTFVSIGGHCSPSSSRLSPGPHTLTAFYSGNGRDNPSSSLPQTLTVVKGETTASLTLSSSLAVVGQENTVDLTITVHGGDTAPAGRVHVTAGDTILCSADLPAGASTATCHMDRNILPPGGHQLHAEYEGDSNYFRSGSAPQDIFIVTDPTDTTLTLPAATLGVDQEAGAQLSYRVSSAVGLDQDPTGTVTISDGSAVICSGLVNGFTGSSCALASAQLPPGTYHLTATYSGDENYRSSTSNPQTLTITQASATTPTSTTLMLSAPRVTFGHEQAERLSVQVTARTGGSPAGQVTIRAGSASVCVITLAKGKGSCALPATRLRPGKYQLTARYGGNPTHQASTSGQKALTVAAEPTATSLKLSAARVRSGHEQAEHLSVQVKPQFSGTPAGKVTIKAGTVRICVITLKNGKGTCTLKASQLPAGTYHLAATYRATAPYAGSTSPKKTLTVTK